MRVDKHASFVIATLTFVAILLFGCGGKLPCQLVNQCQQATEQPQMTQTVTQTPAIPAATIPSPLNLNASELTLLGIQIEPFAASRTVVVLERFANGVMLVFAKSDKGFDVAGSDYILALAKDGHAWRVADTFVETSKNTDTWYTCDSKPGLRPERSGIPWRGFGKAWCEHTEIRNAVGNARSYEESDIDASFQDYQLGRAFRVSDWRGIPGWNSAQTYVVLLQSSDPSFASGRWE
jgi:hypothetical protein